ncbi:MAG: hypothetical protein K5659_09900 [Lachnospiraceae bacterium]|nr:hypothetical protein [Lachnospiraceae bacterium]
MNYNREWEMAKNNLVMNVVNLGFPEELGEEIARQLGSPKAMERMRAYLYNVKPKSVELVIDEMLAIMSDIERWKDKKLSEEANAAYNDVLNYGFGEDEE